LEICGAAALAGALPPAGSEAMLKPVSAKIASVKPMQHNVKPKSDRGLKNAD
jgi:hypothetical protein